MKVLTVATAALGVALSTGAKQLNAADDPLATRAGLELGVQGAHYTFEVPDVTKLSGNRGGIVAAYTLVDPRHLFSRIEVRDSYARLKYEGSGTGGDKVPDNIIEARVLGGMDFFPGRSFSLSPYAGLGYRYQYTDLRNQVGYRYWSNYLYAPVGLTARMHFGGGLVIAPSVEADFFLNGKQDTKYSDTGLPGAHDVMNEQTDGHGYRGSLMIEKEHWAVGVWMQYWKIQASDVQSSGGTNPTAGVVPKNWTREAGLEIRYRF